MLAEGTGGESEASGGLALGQALDEDGAEGLVQAMRGGGGGGEEESAGGVVHGAAPLKCYVGGRATRLKVGGIGPARQEAPPGRIEL